MKSRLMIVVLSLVLAAVATIGVGLYIVRLKSSVTEGQKLVNVLISQAPITEGASTAELFANGSIKSVQVPKRYVAEGALNSVNGYADRVFAADMPKGAQITKSSFKKVDETGLSYKVPAAMLAVSISIDDVTGVGGRLQPGDRIDVIATFSPGAGDIDVSKILLQDIAVLATSEQGTGEKASGFSKSQQSSGGKKNVTLAVFPAQAEKLVFAAEKGHVWLCLRRTGGDKLYTTTGQTVKSVFK